MEIAIGKMEEERCGGGEKENIEKRDSEKKKEEREDREEIIR